LTRPDCSVGHIVSIGGKTRRDAWWWGSSQRDNAPELKIWGKDVLTLDLTLAGDVSLVVDLDGRPRPGAIEVSFDGHVVCRRSEKAFVDWGADEGCC
jgi:hypothetical protein